MADKKYYDTMNDDRDFSVNIARLQANIALAERAGDKNAAETARAEIKYIEELKNKRKDDLARNEQARKNWMKTQLKSEKIISLKTACSQVGQLIVAILEEEPGLTKNEVIGWYDELQVLDEKEGSTIFSNLEKEGVISQKNHRYYVKHILNGQPYLSGKESREFLTAHREKYAKSWKQFSILELLEEKEAISVMDCQNAFIYKAKKENGHKHFSFVDSGINPDMSEEKQELLIQRAIEKEKEMTLAELTDAIEKVLKEMVREGALESRNVDGIVFYSFAMLGWE